MISWFSSVQKVNAAASSESEYVALAVVVNWLCFHRQVKGFVKPLINDNNIGIREDNKGGIKMATNHFSSRRTRHVDVKHINNNVTISKTMNLYPRGVWFADDVMMSFSGVTFVLLCFVLVYIL